MGAKATKPNEWIVSIVFFSCPQDRSIGDLVTNSLTHWLQDTFENTPIQHSERLVTLETCDDSEEETWPNQQKENDKDKDNDNDKDKYKDKDKDKSAENLTLLLSFIRMCRWNFQFNTP